MLERKTGWDITFQPVFCLSRRRKRRATMPKWDAFSLRALSGKARPRITPQNGTQFPVGAKAETASRNLPLKWDTLSQRSPSGKFIPESTLKTGHSFPQEPKRKMRPRIRSQSGTHFPNTDSTESSSRNQVSKWDAVSRWPSIGKLHPGNRLKSGTHFPVEPQSGKAIPFTSKNGRPGC